MKPPFRIVFFGTGSLAVTCLHHLRKHPSWFDVRGIVTQPAKAQGRGQRVQRGVLAQQACGLPVQTPRDLKAGEFFSVLKEWGVQGAVVFSYGRILPPALLSWLGGRAVNFHTSLLPRYRGAAPVQRALLAGENTFGVSLQVMGEGLDTGPLIGQRSFTLKGEEDANHVFHRAGELIPSLFPELVEYMKGNLKPRPQEGVPSYAPKIQKSESLMVWSLPAGKLLNQVRALVSGPQAYTFYRGGTRRLKILKASLTGGSQNTKTGEPGQVVAVGSEGFEVATGEGGALQILKLHPESARASLSAEEFLRGYPLAVGDFLGMVPRGGSFFRWEGVKKTLKSRG